MVNRPVSDSERIDIQHISQAGMTEGSQLKNWPPYTESRERPKKGRLLQIGR